MAIEIWEEGVTLGGVTLGGRYTMPLVIASRLALYDIKVDEMRWICYRLCWGWWLWRVRERERVVSARKASRSRFDLVLLMPNYLLNINVNKNYLNYPSL